MFKKIFGPKIHEGQGQPVGVDEIKSALMAFFPVEGEMNQHLTFEESEKTNAGFAAVWEYYMIDRDSEGMRGKYLLKHSILVDIREDEKAVYFKHKHFARTKRPPKGEPVYEPWYTAIGIGTIDEIQAKNAKKVKTWSSKKVLEPLVEKAVKLGWDAYL